MGCPPLPQVFPKEIGIKITNALLLLKTHYLAHTPGGHNLENRPCAVLQYPKELMWQVIQQIMTKVRIFQFGQVMKFSELWAVFAEGPAVAAQFPEGFKGHMCANAKKR